jgi:RimJ/RimL family protein N-acetyltransferase
MITIRRARPGDEVGVAAMVREGLKRKNWLYTGTREAPNKKRLKKWRAQYRNTDHLQFLALDGKKVVGSTSGDLGRQRTRHVVWGIGWGVHPDYQRKGIGTKLLRKLISYAKKRGFRRFEAEVAVENAASLKLARKCGFRIEGRKKRALLTDDGRYIDVYVMGRLLNSRL